mmetsp:Transcript_93231/g.290689  ORF Transcript_93231/g.290689 Transcript_93231/m.290689 type:complete len:234 (+) Transcript_93231:229-930(+)
MGDHLAPKEEALLLQAPQPRVPAHDDHVCSDDARRHALRARGMPYHHSHHDLPGVRLRPGLRRLGRLLDLPQEGVVLPSPPTRLPLRRGPGHHDRGAVRLPGAERQRWLPGHRGPPHGVRRPGGRRRGVGAGEAALVLCPPRHRVRDDDDDDAGAGAGAGVVVVVVSHPMPWWTQHQCRLSGSHASTPAARPPNAVRRPSMPRKPPLPLCSWQSYSSAVVVAGPPTKWQPRWW